MHRGFSNREKERKDKKGSKEKTALHLVRIRMNEGQKVSERRSEAQRRL